MSDSNADVLLRPAVPADARGVAEVHVASWRTTYAGVVPADYLALLSVDARERQWSERIEQALDPAQQRWVVVATSSEDDVLGFVSAGPRVEGPAGYAAEIYALYLLASAQRRGIGRRLIGHVAPLLVGAGMSSMALWVLAANPARFFYLRLGATLIASAVDVVGGAELEKLAFGWRDIAPLGSL